MTTDRFRELADDDPPFGPAGMAANIFRDPESLSSVYRLPRGRWRSLGEHLDYTDWPERERFAQLDREIKAARGAEPEKQSRQFLSRPSRLPNRVSSVSVVRRIGK